MKKSILALATLLKWIGAAAIAGMMILTCADVVMRAFGKPIFGAVEVVGFMATIALGCSLPYTHLMRGHVGVDMLVRRFPEKVQGGVDIFTNLLSIGLFILTAWRCFLYANTLKASGEVSMTLQFPNYIFVHLIGFSFVILCLVLTLDLIEAIRKAVGK